MPGTAVSRCKRILYTQRPTGGGSTRSLYELVRGLDRNRFEPIVLFLKDSEYRQEFEAIGIKVIVLSEYMQGSQLASAGRSDRTQKINGKYPFGKSLSILIDDISIGWLIRRILRNLQVDLVHHNCGFYRSVMMAARLTGVPQVNHFRLFGGISVSEKLMLTDKQSLIFISKAVEDHYVKRGAPAAQSTVIYNPIDIDRFSAGRKQTRMRQEFVSGKDEWIISNVGRITPWKGQKYFLEAMIKVAGVIPNIKVLIVGSAKEKKDKDYLASLKEAISGTSISDKTVFTGLRADIPEIMAASDIVVHSASEPEPFGRVIPEAMAAGTPVVATAAGGVPEIIDDGLNGLLVPTKNSDAIAEAVIKLLSSPALVEAITTKALSDVTARFSVERHVIEVQNIYERLLTA